MYSSSQDYSMDYRRPPNGQYAPGYHEQNRHFQLPPVQRRNNYLPPRQAPSQQHGRVTLQRPRASAQPSPANRPPSKLMETESVLGLSGSESEDDGDYTTEGSDDDQTAYTYAEDDMVADLNCMNTLFFPSKEAETNDLGVIRCHRVGPSSAEVELNISLPTEYLKHLEGADGNGGVMNTLQGICRAPSMNYNPAQYDPALVEENDVEIDPYKQFRERIAPQFYASLIEELSEEEGSDGDTVDSEAEGLVSRPRDDSQIFGVLDAQEEAYQMAIYNELVRDGPKLGSPPSQVFVSDSHSVPSAPASRPSDDASRDQRTHASIDTSLGESSDVFCRPGDSHEEVLNSHLRESTVATTHRVAFEDEGDIPLDMAESASTSQEILRDLAHVEAAPSMDEHSEPGRLATTARMMRMKRISGALPSRELGVNPSFDECGPGKIGKVESPKPKVRETPLEVVSEKKEDSTTTTPKDEKEETWTETRASEERDENPADERDACESRDEREESPFDTCSIENEIANKKIETPTPATPKTLPSKPSKSSKSLDEANPTLSTRGALGESSKPNVAPKKSSSRRKKTARELRKERIRGFDPVRPALAAAALIAMAQKATRPSSPSLESSTPDISNNSTTPKDDDTLEVPDLDELEFHSCDDGFSNHSRSLALEMM
eukprot:Nitzschia sp. Nitz4//scaffold19_size178191//157244//159235//NITZ4_002010-RA/size178191-processed-gene-0.89-mRNA-1//-1//CDS//3329540780//2845//frame0